MSPAAATGSASASTRGMWLLPLFSTLSSLVVKTFYRLSVTGGSIPSAGPVLLVANHPNFLLDPLFVVAVAGRRVRFLAKAPLFRNPLSSWAVRAVGAIPVYRRSDDPSLVAYNRESFRAVSEALLSGSAVGIFPEGWSHNEPSVTPLKTGAARIALGTAAALGRPFPIIPVGIMLPSKHEFRSMAHVEIGPPIRWEPAEATELPQNVRALTERIESALRDCTLNLERWEDAWLIDYSEQIYAAELVGSTDAAPRIQRLRQAISLLADSRRSGEQSALALGSDVEQHARLLAARGLKPDDLRARATLPGTAIWIVRRVALLIPALGAALGVVVFWVPYRLTGIIADRSGEDPNVRATYKLIAGTALFALWIIFLSVVLGRFTGWPGVAAGLLLLPVWAVATLLVGERFHATWLEARRFFLLKTRKRGLGDLRESQRHLALRMRALWESSQSPQTPI